MYRVLVSLQRTIPHLTADHLLSFLNETAVETVLKGLHGVDRRTRSGLIWIGWLICSLFEVGETDEMVETKVFKKESLE